MLTAEDRKLLTDFNRGIAWLKHQQLQEKKRQWVKVSNIQELTGWDKEGLRRARENGLIDWKKDENGIWYDILSINSLLIKKP